MIFDAILRRQYVALQSLVRDHRDRLRARELPRRLLYTVLDPRIRHARADAPDTAVDERRARRRGRRRLPPVDAGSRSMLAVEAGDEGSQEEARPRRLARHRLARVRRSARACSSPICRSMARRSRSTASNLQQPFCTAADCVPVTRSAATSSAATCSLRLVYGRAQLAVIASASVVLGLVVGGIARPDRRLLPGQARHDRSWASFDILLAFPQLVLALSLVDLSSSRRSVDWLGSRRRRPGRMTLTFALGIVSIPILARITRANTLAWSQREFVTRGPRARARSDCRIMVREVLPNVLPAMFSIALLGIAVVIVAEGGLAILGVGVHLPDAVVGQHHRRRVATASQTSPHIVLAPSIVHLPHRAVAQLPRRRRPRPLRRAGELRCEPSPRVAARRATDSPTRRSTARCSRSATSRRTSRRRAGSCARSTACRFTLERGKTLGIVGESGSGKSVLSRSIMGLLPEANVVRDGQHPVRGPRDRRRRRRRRCARYWGTQMAMVFQDPMTVAQPGHADRQPDHRVAALPPRHVARTTPTRPRSRCCSRSASPRPSAGCASTRTSCRAACASG